MSYNNKYGIRILSNRSSVMYRCTYKVVGRTLTFDPNQTIFERLYERDVPNSFSKVSFPSQLDVRAQTEGKLRFIKVITVSFIT